MIKSYKESNTWTTKFYCTVYGQTETLDSVILVLVSDPLLFAAAMTKMQHYHPDTPHKPRTQDKWIEQTSLDPDKPLEGEIVKP